MRFPSAHPVYVPLFVVDAIGGKVSSARREQVKCLTRLRKAAINTSESLIAHHGIFDDHHWPPTRSRLLDDSHGTTWWLLLLTPLPHRMPDPLIMMRSPNES